MDRRRVVAPLCLTLVVQSLISMAAVTVPVFAAAASVDVGVPASYVGGYVGLIYGGAMVSSLLSGGAILRFGALRISQLALACCGIGLWLAVFAHIPAFLLSALVIGMGYGPVTPASSHILIRTTPPSMVSIVFSLKQTGVPLGGAMAGAMVPWLVVFGGWQFAALIVGGCCLLAVALIQPFRSETDRDRQPARPFAFRGMWRPLFLVLRHGPLRTITLVSFCYAATQLSLITYLVLFLTKEVEMTMVSAGFVLCAGQIAGTVGRILWGGLADRYLPCGTLLAVLGIGMAVGGVCTACFSPEWSYGGILLVTILYSAAAIGWNGIYLAEAARLAPGGQVGTAMGGALFFIYLGVVVGPPVFGAIVRHADSYACGFIVFSLMAFAAGMVALAPTVGKGGLRFLKSSIVRKK